MIVRYNYNQQVEPPAPFIYVTVITPDPRAGEAHASRSARIPMQLDIGAALKVIPQRLMGELGLIKFSEVGVGGFRRAPEVEDSFLVRLQIHEWEIEALEVVLGDDSYGLLGRDVLNQFLLTLNGPDLNFTLQLPTSPTPN
jgi:hypothetical protein